MTENDYVATATARQRLKEVLDDRLRGWGDLATFADALLAETKIEYKPRLKAVLVTIPVPDTATIARPEKTRGGTETGIEVHDSSGAHQVQESDAQIAAGVISVHEGADTATGPGNRGEGDWGQDSAPKRPARFGYFEPVASDADEYFTG